MGEIKHTEGPTCEDLDRIANAHWTLGNKVGSTDGVTFFDVQTHNACNHTFSGTIEIDGTVHGFIIDSGDWNGTVVRSWGDPEDVGVAPEPEEQEQITFLPRDGNLFHASPAMWRVYLSWRKEPWFKDLERSYAYDRHFQPGGRTESYYREKASKRGLVPGYLSNLTAEAQASVNGSAALAKANGEAPQ